MAQISTWSVLLAGDANLLRLLPSRFQSPELQVVEEPDDRFYLYSSLFDPAADDVYGPAIEQFSILRGAVAALFGPGHRLGWDSIRRAAADGTTTHIKYGTTVMMGSTSMTAKATGGAPASPDGDPLVQAAMKDTDVRRAFEIFGGWEPHPVNLYKIYEIIKEAVGGQRDLEDRPWSGGKKGMERFRRSMCHQDVSGDLARHERDTSIPPTDPMDLEEAQTYIAGLLRSWGADLK